MNRRNFIKASAYAGITIITSKGIVFPEKKIILQNYKIIYNPVPSIVDENYYLSRWAEMYAIPVKYLRETDNSLRGRILKQIEY